MQCFWLTGLIRLLMKPIFAVASRVATQQHFFSGGRSKSVSLGASSRLIYIKHSSASMLCYGLSMDVKAW